MISEIIGRQSYLKVCIRKKKREKGLGHRSISLCGILRFTQWSLCYCLRDIFKEGERKTEENGGTEGTGGIKVLQLCIYVGPQRRGLQILIMGYLIKKSSVPWE